MCERVLTYLAAPYTHVDAAVRAERMREVDRFAAHMFRQGKVLYSPLSHTVRLAEDNDLPDKWDFWAPTDYVYLSLSKELLVLMLPGWEKSVGVAHEIKYAKEHGIPVEYVEPLD